MTSVDPHIAFFIPSFERGGVERLVINLSREFIRRDVRIDVLVRETDSPIHQLPVEANVVRLDSLASLNGSVHRVLPPHVANATLSLPAYIGYLRRKEPDLLISMQTSPFALLGATLSRTETTLVVRESNTPSVATATPRHKTGRFAPTAKRLTYPRADHVVAVSRDAAKDVADHLGVAPEKVEVIYNPTFNETVVERSTERVAHAWFDDEDVPVVCSVGRFADQKDFETLIRAFDRVRATRPARLALVGDGQNRNSLERLVDELNIGEYVSFFGYQDNPYKYMAKSDVFVLSSNYEGLPNVLIEAIGVGTPAIATDCPSGPREILLDGAGGDLVPVGDVDAMSEAIDRYLEDSAYAAERLENAREGLDRFTPERAAEKYLDLVE